jgi:quercetin dioxygenase-like cupin family protein
VAECAEVVVPSVDLGSDIALLEAHGFRLNTIFPADAPQVARLSGHGVPLRLDTAAVDPAPTIRIPSLDVDATTSAGARLVGASTEFSMPSLDDRYAYIDGGDWGVGRAGMQYRDLIPERQGGRVMASHIRIAEPGPVPDYVHYHDIRFQMIYCRRGAVQVVYEGQGEPFWMVEGDCVLQPPNIRHRVLESADDCEVVEITSPAEHPTFIEHEMSLPTPEIESDRDFGGQQFCFDHGHELAWESLHEGWEHQVFSIAAATKGLASVRIVRPGVDDATQISGSHDGDLCLFFVLGGGAWLEVGEDRQLLSVDDSVAIPIKTPWRLSEASGDFLALHVTLHGDPQ